MLCALPVMLGRLFTARFSPGVPQLLLLLPPNKYDLLKSRVLWPTQTLSVMGQAGGRGNAGASSTVGQSVHTWPSCQSRILLDFNLKCSSVYDM